MKAFLFLAAISPAAFGFELSRDTLESKFTGGDSVWLINRSPQTVRIHSLYVKRLSGQVGNGLLFTVSNETRTQLMGSTHNYRLQADGDSLIAPPALQGSNPEIRIPPRDSIHIKNILYGNCIYCLTTYPLFNYAIAVNFVETGKPPVELVVVGNFVSGAARRAAAPPIPYRQAGLPYRLDGRLLAPESGPSVAARRASPPAADAASASR